MQGFYGSEEPSRSVRGLDPWFPACVLWAVRVLEARVSAFLRQASTGMSVPLRIPFCSTARLASASDQVINFYLLAHALPLSGSADLPTQLLDI